MDETTSARASWDWLGEIFSGWLRWVREHLLITIVLSAAAFVFGWLWNVYVMAVRLDGSDPGGERTVATAQGRPFNAFFWVLLFSLLTGLVTYGWQRGWKQMGEDFRVLPRRFAKALSGDMEASTALLLWGVGVALVTSTVITSAVSLALGLVLVTLAATPLGVIVNFAVIRLWRGLTGVASPESGTDVTAFAGPFLMMVGEGFGLFVDWGANSWVFSLVVGILAGGGSLVLGRRGHAGVVAGMCLVGATILLGLAHSHPASADDGGWSECITDSGEACQGLGGLFAWFGSDGASTVMSYALLGGIFSGVGTAVGFGIGAAAAVGVASSAASAASSAAEAASGPPDLHGGAESDRSMGADSDSERTSSAGVDQQEDSPPDPPDPPEPPERPAIAGGDTLESSEGPTAVEVAAAEVSDVLPEPPERDAKHVQAETPDEHVPTDADATDGSAEPQPLSTAADPTLISQGQPGADISDVLPEPPDRKDERSDEA
jgi:hypothetical protein